MTDIRLVPCEFCGTEGRVIVARWPSRMNELPEKDCGPCPHCEGTGSAIVDVQPIEIGDIEQEAGQ